MPPERIQYLKGTSRFGARKIIAVPAIKKNIPVAPCLTVPARNTAAMEPRIKKPWTAIERKGE
jgi:hypothetical protein